MKIVYKSLTMEDSEEFFKLVSDERVAAKMRFDCPNSKEKSDIILAEYISENNKAYALRFQPKGEMWGVFAFKGNVDADSASISHMISQNQWGKGISQQVITDMLDLAKKEHWYKTIEGYVLETNIASRKIAERNGFKQKERYRLRGMTEDLLVYSISI